MTSSLKIKNIVLVGGFNPIAFDKYFFIKNLIFKEEEIFETSIFESFGVQLNSNILQITIGLNQIIVTSINPENDLDKINETLLSIIKLGNLKNISALGINFNWFKATNKESLAVLSKNLFYNEKVPIFSEFFNTEDAVFGVYASKQFKNSRLKLDIKPSKLQDLENKSVYDGITFLFNFHFDFNDKNDNIEVIQSIEQYFEFKKESEKMMKLY